MAVDRRGKKADDPLAMLGQAIKDALTDAGHTRKWLAEKIGVDPAAVTRMTAGQMPDMTLVRALEVEEALGLGGGGLLRRAGLVKDLGSVRDAINTDSTLVAGDRAAILRVYDVCSASGSKMAPTARSRRRS